MSQSEIPSLLPNPSLDTIKEISQEVIEEKQCIIQQIYKQLRASLSTTNYLTQQLETLKAATFEIDLSQLKNQGFVRQDNHRSLLVLDTTKAFERGLEKLILDVNVEILHEEVSIDLGEKLAGIQAGYKRAVQQVQLLLRALQEKQQKQARIHEVLESKENSLAALGRLIEQGKQRQAELMQIIAEKQRKEFTIQQQLASKQSTQLYDQQILGKKQEQYQSLLSELAQKQRLIDSLQSQQIKPEANEAAQEAKELHEEIELLQMQLEQQKRQRALEKAEWKQELHKLKDQLVQRQADDQVQQDNMAQLQSDNQGLRKEINDLKDIVIRLQKKRESQCNNLAQVGSLPNQNRVTNDILIKTHEDELAIQSPHHFLPYQINSMEYFHIQNQPVPPTAPELKPESQQPNANESIPQLVQPQPQPTEPPFVQNEPESKQVAQPIQSEGQLLQPEGGQYTLSSPEREPKQASPEVEPTICKNQQIDHTNKSFPDAITDKKDEKEVETMPHEAKQEVDKQKDPEEKRSPQNQGQHQQNKRKHRLNKGAQIGLKPMKPDKPGKHRKVIRINY